MRACRVLALFMSTALSITTDLALGSTEVATMSTGVRTGDNKTAKTPPNAESLAGQDQENRMEFPSNLVSKLAEDDQKIMDYVTPDTFDKIKSSLATVAVTGHSEDTVANANLLERLKKYPIIPKDLDSELQALSQENLKEWDLETSLFIQLYLRNKNPYQVGHALKKILPAGHDLFLNDFTTRYDLFMQHLDRFRGGRAIRARWAKLREQERAKKSSSV